LRPARAVQTAPPPHDQKEGNFPPGLERRGGELIAFREDHVDVEWKAESRAERKDVSIVRKEKLESGRRHSGREVGHPFRKKKAGVGRKK